MLRVTALPLIVPAKGALSTETDSLGAVPEMVSAMMVPWIPLPEDCLLYTSRCV